MKSGRVKLVPSAETSWTRNLNLKIPMTAYYIVFTGVNETRIRYQYSMGF
jgi:hypothetical protein